MKEEKLVVGVIGLGMGKSHLKGAIACGAEVGGVCDTNPDKLKAVGKELGIDESKLTTDYKAIIANPNINVVIIATPDQLHRQMIEEAIAAGKHIMCEKPLALTREDLCAIVQTANRSDKKFMVGQICRFTPGFIRAKEILDSGEIGELYFVESEYAHDYVNILGPGNWRTDPIRNGVVGGGCHAVDLLRWYVGDPYEVFAYGVHKLLPQVPYDDANIAVMKFPNDVIGKVFVSTGCKRNYTMRTCLYGTKGTIICDNTSPEIEVFSLRGGKNTVFSKPDRLAVDINNHNAQGEFEVFAKHIMEDTPVEMTATEGAKTIEACFAIIESAKTGMPVHPNYNF